MRYFLDQIARCEFEHVTSVTSHVFDLTPCNWVEWYSTCWQCSKMGTMLPIKHIFMSPIPFSKNHRDLKYEYYLRKFANTFILLQRTIAQKKICNLVWFSIFLDPQMVKIVSAHSKGKNNILVSLQILLLHKVRFIL